ncbi:MAG: phospholipase [Erythrobacter sp. 34-65-8]|nr:MAG: phospholipase [Erythrobacter sp. 34-65-8]
MQDAMLRAEQRILMIGWDFDTRIHLETGRRWWRKGTDRSHPSRLGSFILWLNRHRPGLDIKMLKWGMGMIPMALRGSMALDLLRWAPRRRIDFKWDSAHPMGACHHQKIVVIDDQLAVCGGIDMTRGRWDTRDHVEDDPRRRWSRWKQYGPWHDATMIMAGAIVKDLDELGRDRWCRAGGDALTPVNPTTGKCWPEGLEPQFENVEVGIARTRAAHENSPQVCEIADLFERQIREARHFIYAESQYFASRRIADAIARRMAEPDPPEILIVHPANADGWLEQQAMDHARAQLVRTLGEVDQAGRFNLYVPYTGETPIYVHSKIMIVDDAIIRIGSANMNNRSMGLDSECDVFIDARRPGNAHARGAIANLRHSLLAEHCGLEMDDVPRLIEQAGSMHAMIQALGQERTRTLRRFDLEQLNGMAETLAESAMLDPERPDELLEPFAKGGLFRKGMFLSRIRNRTRKKAA